MGRSYASRATAEAVADKLTKRGPHLYVVGLSGPPWEVAPKLPDGFVPPGVQVAYTAIVKALESPLSFFVKDEQDEQEAPTSGGQPIALDLDMTSPPGSATSPIKTPSKPYAGVVAWNDQWCCEVMGLLVQEQMAPWNIVVEVGNQEICFTSSEVLHLKYKSLMLEGGDLVKMVVMTVPLVVLAKKALWNLVPAGCLEGTSEGLGLKAMYLTEPNDM